MSVHREIKKKAIDLLSRREHTRRELVNKLTHRGFDLTLVHEIIDELAKKNLQSDTRFAELFTEQRIIKGFGPIKVRAQLHARGVAAELIADALKNADVDWVYNANKAVEKKFNLSQAGEINLITSNKCRRFLFSRGFNQEQIRKALHGYQIESA